MSDQHATVRRLFHGGGSAQVGAGPTLPDCEASRATRRRLGEDQGLVHLRQEDIAIVNTALLLSRPLLVTGPPGVGKAQLAYLIALELDLGPVLPWGIVSRTALKEGLYAYDAIDRAQAIVAWRAGAELGAGEQALRMGDFVPLGPLGTALLPYEQPRVLLIDELDKSDIGLPNDLLHVLEDGSYDSPELKRSSEDAISVFTDDPGARTRVDRGLVECREFSVVVITSNGECEFPLVFRRRCLPLELRLLSCERLLSNVASHLSGSEDVVGDLVDDSERRVQNGGTHSVDQLLNAVRRATTGGVQPDADGRKRGAGWAAPAADKLLTTLAPGRPHGTRPPLTAVPAPPFVAVPVPRAVQRDQYGPGLPSAARHRGPAASAPRTRRRHGPDARPQHASRLVHCVGRPGHRRAGCAPHAADAARGSPRQGRPRARPAHPQDRRTVPSPRRRAPTTSPRS
ncbi:MoxR family ATPase [Streptomyces sp. NPDC050400]|uniref:MoxR family ATPase n=1 Tax=Streptomyces sp. NPDC050400 TaxID=3365610 RepID=UPI0037B00E5A